MKHLVLISTAFAMLGCLLLPPTEAHAKSPKKKRPTSTKADYGDNAALMGFVGSFAMLQGMSLARQGIQRGNLGDELGDSGQDPLILKSRYPTGPKYFATSALLGAAVPALSIIALDKMSDSRLSYSERSDFVKKGRRASLLGPAGKRSFIGPKRAIYLDYGYSRTNISAQVYDLATTSEVEDPSTSGANSFTASGELHGPATEFSLRLRVLRLSLGYARHGGRLLDAQDVSRVEPSTTEISQNQQFLTLQGAWGLQFFQGILSPYIQHRVRKPILLHTSGWIVARGPDDFGGETNDDELRGVWVTELSHTVSVGNTFDLSGMFLTRNRDRAVIHLDLRYDRAIKGSLEHGIQASLGLTSSWF